MKNSNLPHTNAPKTSGGGGGAGRWIMLSVIASGVVFIAGAGYSLGKNEDDKNSDLYKAAIAFLVIGILMVLGLGTWLALTHSKAANNKFAAVFSNL